MTPKRTTSNAHVTECNKVRAWIEEKCECGKERGKPLPKFSTLPEGCTWMQGDTVTIVLKDEEEMKEEENKQFKSSDYQSITSIMKETKRSTTPERSMTRTFGDAYKI